MGVDGVIMFRRYDRDGDGVLSMEEFEPLAHRLLELNVSAFTRVQPINAFYFLDVFFSLDLSYDAIIWND